jgi:hypothetical protein
MTRFTHFVIDVHASLLVVTNQSPLEAITACYVSKTAQNCAPCAKKCDLSRIKADASLVWNADASNVTNRRLHWTATYALTANARSINATTRKWQARNIVRIVTKKENAHKKAATAFAVVGSMFVINAIGH